MHRNLWLIILLIFPLFFSCSTGLSGTVTRHEVTVNQAEAALAHAVSALGKPYVWGGNGPDAYDCSGLIVSAYREALQRDHIFFDGVAVVDDITMQTFYDYNIRPIKAAEVIPGDIIFITDRTAVTHGGLVETVSDAKVTFINASSFYGAVERDTWNLANEVRGQRIKRFGRFLTRNPG